MAQHPTKIDDLLAKCNLKGRWTLGANLAEHCTFRVGGPADALVFPASPEDVAAVRQLAREQSLPFSVLGRGANLLVSDRGIRGLTVAMTSLRGCSLSDGLLTLAAGTDVSDAAAFGRDHSVSCLEFLNGMPSTVGGAVWMNARCYGAEIADLLHDVLVLDENNQTCRIPFEASQWSYKLSPFQNRDWVILEARFRATPVERGDIEAVMATNLADRTQKGHFRAPCAGSVFKNNHAFGAPSGVLIDSCGLKGLRRGGAVVSDWHANIIINDDSATAGDVRNLIGEVKREVALKTGHTLEEEVLYTGDW
jgi:UDP-N-acetylmuramate dehydrogenase